MPQLARHGWDRSPGPGPFYRSRLHAGPAGRGDVESCPGNVGSNAAAADTAAGPERAGCGRPVRVFLLSPILRHTRRCRTRQAPLFGTALRALSWERGIEGRRRASAAGMALDG